ncbi:MAG: carboxypeptidase regulatory-like domain-containing protein, partial [Pseudoxanthomonas sp.]
LVRASGTLDAGQRAALADIGLPLRGDGDIRAVRPDLASPPPAGASADADIDAAPVLERLPLALAADDAVALARDADGHAWAWWRPHGRGRIGFSSLTDSYRLVLAGAGDAHAALWSALLTPLARPHPATTADTQTGWRDERLILCGLGEHAGVRAPDGASVPLLRDPASGCAGLWPRQAGLYTWQGEDRHGRVLVRDPADAPVLFANQQRQATLALRRAGPASSTAIQASPVPGPRWPGWLAFVVLAALLWWLERRPPPAAPATQI